MSTRVLTPVRVKPPPADTGEIISPSSASFEMATPSNGARMTMSSSWVRNTSISRSATTTCSRDRAMRAASESTSAVSVSRSAAPTTPSSTSRRVRARLSWASFSRTSCSAMARREATSRASARASCERTVESSSRARTCPSRTVMPSSTSTATSLPVTFDETVAWRRAVT